MYRKSFR